MPSPLSADTSTDAANAQFSAWRAMTPGEKLVQVRELTKAVLWLEREGLRLRHPELSSEDLHWAAIARRLGPELFMRVYSS